jgi:hypothetical protein
LLGKPVKHVPQNIDIVCQREFHHLQLLRIKQVPKRHRVTNETMERLCDRRFGRGIDQQLRHLIRKIVASGSVHGPVLAQGLGAGDDFLRQHVNRAAILGQFDPQRFRAALLKLFEIFAR